MTDRIGITGKMSVCIFLILCSLMSPRTGIAAADLDAILQMILDAPKTVNYEGILVHQWYREPSDSIRITQRVVHQRPDRDRIDLIDPSSMQKEVKIQIKGNVYQRETRGDSTHYSHRRRQADNVVDLGLGFSSLDILQTNYDLTVQADEMILNRRALKLAIQPRHPKRFSKTAWIDRETGLVLRTEYRDERGNLLEEVFFSRIMIDSAIDDALFSTEAWTNRSVEEDKVVACGSIQEVQKEAGFTLAAPVYIPAGFALDRLRVIRYSRAAGQPLLYFMYTDGLARISLFQRIAPPADKIAKAWPKGTPERRGDVQVWKRGQFPYTILRRRDDSKLYTVISEISEEESIQMIESLCVIKASAPTDASDFAYMPWLTGGLIVGSLSLGGWLFRRRHSML